jgi:hypothetical protein
VKRGHPLTREDIAAWCDCTQGTIENIEAAAMENVYRGLRKLGINADSLPM